MNIDTGPFRPDDKPPCRDHPDDFVFERSIDPVTARNAVNMCRACPLYAACQELLADNQARGWTAYAIYAGRVFDKRGHEVPLDEVAGIGRMGRPPRKHAA